MLDAVDRRRDRRGSVVASRLGILGGALTDPSGTQRARTPDTAA